MGLENLFEYGKIGIGSAVFLKGVQKYFNHEFSKTVLETTFKNIDSVNTENLLQAYNQYSQFIDTIPKNYDAGIGVILGAICIAWGVDNLIQNYKKITPLQVSEKPKELNEDDFMT